jgi:fluoroacetyl-CoA thioesterase
MTDYTLLYPTGMTHDESYIVGEQDLASHIGSGASRVLATPCMILFMERTAHRLLAQKLPQGYSSVGVEVQVKHLAPTPMGSTVHVLATVEAVDGLKVNFRIEAWDEVEKIGDGTHQRFIIDESRFLKRVLAKNETNSTL